MSDAQIEAAARNLETTAKIDQFSSILFGAVAPEGEPREALAALVTYARDREAEAERHEVEAEVPACCQRLEAEAERRGRGERGRGDGEVFQARPHRPSR